MIKVGLSEVSMENAQENLLTEIPDWDFDKVVTEAQNQWELELDKITVDGTLAQK